MQKLQNIEDYEVKYKKHPFSKTIKITLKPQKQILVTMPYFCPYKKAKEFLDENFEKIKSFNFEPQKLSQDLKTKFDTLKIVEAQELKTKISKNIVWFYYPKNLDFSSPLIQNELRKAHFSALKIEARNYLIQRLDFLSKKYGFQYKKVFLKNQKTRFGSCSFQNNINLNINLMNYDFDVIDYVLIHELVHTRVKNHSSAFWSEVEKYCPKYKELRRKLKMRLK